MPVPHLRQRDPGRTRDSPRGRRSITTLRKLPTTAPKTAAIKIIPVVPGLSTPQGTPFPTDQGMYRRARRRSLTPSGRDTVHLDRSTPDSTCLIAAGPEYFGPIHVCPIHVGVTERGPAYWREPFWLLILGAYSESHASSGCASLGESVSWSNSY